MSDLAIEIEDLHKVFRLYPDLVRSRIKQHIFVWNKYYREKEALTGVNLQVRKGEVLGVIGPNGAGKTTLLKIIAGISLPTRGRVKVNGRVVAVLALGLGFHPRLTGLQNISLAGMMLGMSRQEIDRKRDWIIDFAELDQYIGSPLTTYSTGMRARLSFAVAACQDPEILIVDEALATGDVRFVQKCIDRIHQITKSGTTALFVSHNIWSMKRLTNRCILINEGRITDDGETSLVSDRYYEYMLQDETLEQQRDLTDSFVGSGEVRLRRAALRDAQGRDTDLLNAGEPASILLELMNAGPAKKVGMSLILHRGDGIMATALAGVAGGSLNEHNEFVQTTVSIDNGLTTVRIELAQLMLAPGDFSAELHLFDPDNHSGFTSSQQYFFKTRIIVFGVRRIGNPNRSIVFYQPAAVSTGAWSDARAS